MIFNEKYLIEGMDADGKWVKFNVYELTLNEVKQKAANVILKTNYIGVRIIKV